ncbi:MAG: phospholipid carrier-dependent glycosyltransferase [Symploca sp. SIO2E6]|nr:phospholipid carrier-dependent glycosyltransferase [Symploca sp. SIO2E6]
MKVVSSLLPTYKSDSHELSFTTKDENSGISASPRPRVPASIFRLVWWLLGGIWLLGALCDRIWLFLDHAIPAWDATNHLTGSLNYLDALQHAQWFSGDWWRSLWMLSSKNPPLIYIITAPFQQVFGTGPDQALLVNLLFSAILLGSVYSLGKHLFNQQVGLWSAGLCVLLPRLYEFRIHYLLDYSLTALVAASFCCLTVWRDTKTQRQGWLWSLGFGICFGCAMMVKQSALFFLLVPLLWLGCKALWQKAWQRLAQLTIGLLVSFLILAPWYSTNWIFFFSAHQSGIVSAAAAEGDPPLNTLAAWTVYWRDLPAAVSWPLLIVPIVGLLLHWLRPLLGWGSRGRGVGANPSSIDSGASNATVQTPVSPQHTQQPLVNSLPWLTIFLVASYFICSAIVNKDTRYIMPYLPILSVILAYGLTLWPRRWQAVRWSTIGLALLLMFLNLFPIAGKGGIYLTQTLSPHSQSYPYRGVKWPHSQVIAEIISTQPQLQATVGVIPSLPPINHNNVNYYGALEQFQVYGRQVGQREQQVQQDWRSLCWFLTKTNSEAAYKPSEALLVKTVEQTPNFQLQKNWLLPDNTFLQLYHCTQPPIQVKQLEQTLAKVSLDQVRIPERVPAGVPVPVTYQWSGPWEQLQSGLVLLTWKSQKTEKNNLELSPKSFDWELNNPENSAQPSLSHPSFPMLHQWFHDHGIALGQLHSGRLSNSQLLGSFQVTEQMAMLPPKALATGIYTLEATYLNRSTGQHYPIPVPTVTLTIDPNAPAIPAPELDLVTQLRNLASTLPQGRVALEPIFDEIGRINQYDPVQDYTKQAELALEFRLQSEQHQDLAYGLALARALQEDVDGAIAALQQVVQLDSQNPYAHAYLAFVYLYDWRLQEAQDAIRAALYLNPNIPEIQALSGIIALLRGNVFQAWLILRRLEL